MTKSIMLTLRVSEEIEHKIEEAHQDLIEQSDPYLPKPTRTDAIIFLLQLGLDAYSVQKAKKQSLRRN